MGGSDHTANAGEPTLGEAWGMLGQRLGLAVAVRGDASMRAEGVVEGRAVVVDIHGERHGSEFARSFFGGGTRNQKVRMRWRSELSIGVRNPHGLIGSIDSFVDVNDPSWNPRDFDPANGRVVRTEPPQLGARLLQPSVVERLRTINGDIRMHVGASWLQFADERTTALGGGYVAGSLLHQVAGSPVPWPDRALVGPLWWIRLAWDIANLIDA